MGNLSPNPATAPNLYAWYAIVSKFAEGVSSKWAAGDLPRPAAAQQKAAEPAKAAAAPADEIDEDDLFGDDDAGEAAAAALAAKKKAEAPKK